MSNYRVLHATESMASGTLSVLRDLVTALDASGVSQTVLFCRRPETPDRVRDLFPSRVEMIETAPAGGLQLGFMLEFYRNLIRLVETFEPDAVHLHSSKAGFVGRIALFGRQGCRVLYSPHGLSFLNPTTPVRNHFFRLLERFAFLGGAEGVGCSAYEKQLLERVSRRPAAALTNAVRTPVTQSRRVEDDRPLVLGIGRLCEQKNPDQFARICQAVRMESPQVRFLWVGDGEERFRTRLSDAGCQVSGWLEPSAVEELLGETSIYLQTSKWEGLSISLLQAMAASVVCVASDIPGNRDAIDHGVNGYLESGTAAHVTRLKELLKDPTTRRRVGVKAREAVLDRFSDGSFNCSVRALYELDR